MGLLIANKTPHEIWIGNNQDVKQIYLGNNLIWSKPEIPWTFFDSGYIDGITWDNNFYTLSSSTAAEGGGISNSSIHFMSSNPSAKANASTPVYIPWNASVLKVEVGRYYQSGRTYPKMSFGFLPNQSGIGMEDTSAGGILSSATVNMSGGSLVFGEYSLEIPDEYKCSSDYRVIVSYVGSSNYNRSDLYIRKVWFE